MDVSRRLFLKTAAAGAAGAAVLAPAARTDASAVSPELVAARRGVLVDTTKCVGCRACEAACSEANALPPPDPDAAVFDRPRKPSEAQFTVVDRRRTGSGEVFVKRQCLHCLQPACASACLTRAMLKTPEGPVIWRADKCMGCRFCMISCPMDIPAFEYHSAMPKIRKCQLCLDRLKAGLQPGCVEVCPSGALVSGTRVDMIAEARRRLVTEPDRYVAHVFGEHEAGGTGVLYLSAVPFADLGFRADLGPSPFPELTKEFLYAVPVVLSVVPALLLGLSQATNRADGITAQGAHDAHQ